MTHSLFLLYDKVNVRQNNVRVLYVRYRKKTVAYGRTLRRRIAIDCTKSYVV